MSEQIIQLPMRNVISQKYLDYAMYSIQDRALPNVVDGLKPVALRILYSMYKNNIRSHDKKVKSAKTVGDVIGTTHPHGDSSVYMAMVNLAQEWSTRYPIIDFQGNNGSRDGDTPAAYRYTETRLSEYGEYMLKDLYKDTVDFKPNFDGTITEPISACNMIPNFLANGTDGIAAGMATSIPPHNLTELYNACLYMIDNVDKEITSKELMQFVKGPDFPDGGIIVDTKDLLKAYETGKGRVILKAKYSFETINKDQAIVIKELPYQTNKLALKEKIDSLHKDGKIEGIKKVLDASNKGKVEMIIYLKKSANPTFVANKLLKMTDLQKSISFNVMGLVNRQPVQLSLVDALEHFLSHCVDVLRRRTQYDYNKYASRAHIIEGLMIAAHNVSEIDNIIRTSDNSISDLMSSFSLSEIQAKYIDDMKIKALSNQNVDKLQIELTEKYEQMNIWNSILTDESIMLETLSKELIELREKFGDERRTTIDLTASGDISEEDLVKDETLIVTLTSEGFIKSVLEKEYNAQRRGGKGNKAATTKDEEVVTDLFTVNSKDDLLFITNLGKCHKIKAYKLPKVARTAKGKHINNYMNVEENEYPVTTIATKLNDPTASILFATKLGMIKRLSVSQLSSRMATTKVLGLKDGDELVSAIMVQDTDSILIGTAKGQATRFDISYTLTEAERILKEEASVELKNKKRLNAIEAGKINPEDTQEAVLDISHISGSETICNIRCMGRSSIGNTGIKLKDNDYVVGMIVVEPSSYVMTVTTKGLGKKTKEKLFSVATKRGGSGVKLHKVTSKTGDVVSILSIKDDEHVLIGTEEMIIRLDSNNIAESGRDTNGSKLINLKSDDEVFTASLAPKTEEELEEDNIILEEV